MFLIKAQYLAFKIYLMVADPVRVQTHAARIVSLAGLFLRSGAPSVPRAQWQLLGKNRWHRLQKRPRPKQ